MLSLVASLHKAVSAMHVLKIEASSPFRAKLLADEMCRTRDQGSDWCGFYIPAAPSREPAAAVAPIVAEHGFVFCVVSGGKPKLEEFRLRSIKIIKVELFRNTTIPQVRSKHPPENPELIYKRGNVITLSHS